jgi:hypothetical protein
MERIYQFVEYPYLKAEDIFEKIGSKRTLWIVAVISTFLGIIYFGKLLLHPSDYIFAYYSDDLKNYFTLLSYLNLPRDGSLLHYTGMNYPFGDIIYYTDNTPLLSLPLKFVSELFGVRINPIPIFSYVVVMNFIATSLVLHLLFKELFSSKTLAVLLSIILPYTNPQAFRIISGTENLSLSIFIVVTLYLLYRMYCDVQDNKASYRNITLLSVLILTSVFVHFYILVIITASACCFLFTNALLKISYRKEFIKYMALTAVPVLAFIAAFLLVRFTDTFYELRNKTALGYDLPDWKLNLEGLYSPPKFLKIHFPYERFELLNAEAHVYLGSFALYGFFAAAIAALLYAKQFTTKSKGVKFALTLFASSLVMLFISLGKEIEFKGETVCYNYLNTFNYAADFTPMIHHFRCLGRFAWVPFWSINLLIAVSIDGLLLKRNRLMIGLFYVLTFFAIKDMTATGEEYRRTIYDNILSTKYMPDEVLKLNNIIAGKKYDAILPLPFFLVGSEVYDRTLDPTYDYAIFYEQLASASNLPLMSTLMSRTPLPFNESLFNLFATSKMDSLLTEKMRGKKIAVVFSNNQYDERKNWIPIDSKDVLEAFENSKKLPVNLNMNLVDSTNGYLVYEWVVK